MKPKYFLYDRAFDKAFNKYKLGLSEAERKKLKKQFEIFREDVFDKRLRTHRHLACDSVVGRGVDLRPTIRVAFPFLSRLPIRDSRFHFRDAVSRFAIRDSRFTMPFSSLFPRS